MAIQHRNFVPPGYGVELLDVPLFGAAPGLLTVDGSITPVVVEIVPPPGKFFLIKQVIIAIDRPAVPIVPIDFGTISGNLANGLLIENVDDDGVLLNLTNVFPGVGVRSNEEMALFSTQPPQMDNPIALCVSFQYEIAYGFEALLGGAKSHRLRVTVQDNLSTLSSLVVLARGNLLNDNN